MDQVVDQQPEIVVPKKRNPLEIILIFVIIIIFIIIALLYFNVIPLNKFFQQNNKPVASTSTPKSILLFEKTAKTTFNNFFVRILAPSALPRESINFKQAKGIQESFSASWDTKNGTGSAILITLPNGDNLIQSYVAFQFPQNTSPSATLAQQITSQFFSLRPKNPFICKLYYPNTFYCESFWTENEKIKRGIGIITPYSFRGSAPTTIAFFCEHTDLSKIFSWKSCDDKFAEKGLE